MRVAVIDIGSNTARLLIADVDGDAVEPVAGAKRFLRLGSEIERRGAIRPRKVRETAEVAAGFAASARTHGFENAVVLVTAPGRQVRDADPLVSALSHATGWPVRLLTHREEGAFAFDGAIGAARGELPEVVGVVDVGGGSTEIAVGTLLLGAAWVHSLDVGSLRLTRRVLPDDPPTTRQVARARSLVCRSLRDVRGPVPDALLAVGGTARTLGRTLGPRFGADALDVLVEDCTGRPLRETADMLAIDTERAMTLVAGAVLLGGVARMVGRDLEVARGGLREGAALALAHAPSAARAA